MARPPARQGEFPVAAPVAGGLPAPLLRHRPAFAHPEFRPPVAPIGDEGGEFGIGHQPLADGERFQPDPVPGRLVVEVEAASPCWRPCPGGDGRSPPGRRRCSSQRGSPLGTAAPGGIEAGLRAIRAVEDGGFQRIAAEAVEQIHQQQLLMLLFVLQAQLHQGQQGIGGGARTSLQVLQQILQPLVHPVAPGQHLRDRGSAQQAPLGPGMAGADAVVIGVEQVAPAAIGRLVALQVRLQQERLEEPGGVGQMPFGGARIRHPLQAEVLALESLDQAFAVLPHLEQPFPQGGGVEGRAHRRSDRWGRP